MTRYLSQFINMLKKLTRSIFGERLGVDLIWVSFHVDKFPGYYFWCLEKYIHT